MEFAFRTLLFSDLTFMKPLQRPEQYADFLSEDLYWNLYAEWDGRYPPPSSVHPVLGWTDKFDPETLAFDGAAPEVLLYGDSYAACVDEVDCFDTWIPGLLNYGMGGYGTDQILLLMEGSLHHYPEVPVVVMLMPLDLDRAALCLRIGQKPCFAAVDDELIPREPGSSWGLMSYRKLLFASFTPPGLRSALRGEPAIQREKEALNRLILRRMLEATDGRERVFVAFHTHFGGVQRLDGPPDWRDTLMAEELEGETLISARSLLPEGDLGWTRWIRPSDGHPTTEYNRRVAEAVNEALR